MPVNELLRARSQALVASLSSHRIILYSLVSAFAVFVAVANALVNYSNFYSIAIFLSRSSRSILILANFAVVIALLSGRIVQQIFFGPLRAVEVERLYDRLWFFVTESLLAFTIFRDDFDIPFGIMFGFLLFVKSFHWLASDRIEWMEQRQYPGPPPLFHIRMTTLFLLLWTTDFVMFAIAVESTLASGVGGMVLFACEYAILMASVGNTLSKYLLTAYELRRAGRRGGENAPQWENKSMWVFYIELVTDFLKLSTYLLFFVVITASHGLPLNMIRDVYITARSFITRIAALRRYQTATRNMDERYPNPTEAELSAMSDRTCIICREEISMPRPTEGQTPQAQNDGPNMTPKKLPCGHIFHFHCLRSWLERQQSCPTCRRSVLEPDSNQRPGPARRPVNPGPQAEARLPQGNQQPLGLIGRLLGGAAQPPMVPGQFAHGPAVAPNPAGPHNHNDPQNVIIQYNIQLGQRLPPNTLQPAQTPPANQPPTVPVNPAAAAQPGRPLQPAPRLAGFYGPAGNMQPWNMDERWFGEDVRNATPAEPAPTDGPQSTEPVTSTSPVSQQDHLNSSDSAPPSPEPMAETESQSMTPREASLIAALRRQNSSAASGRPDPSPPPGIDLSDGGVAVDVPSTSTEGAPSQEPADIPSEIPSSVPAQHTTSTSPLPNRYSIPRLIPLYDQNSQRTRLPNRISPYLQPPLSVPPRPLPATLTQEELNRMDQLTRDGIDERLRVLENVSRTINSCIDDLLRMRSVLPVVPSSTQNGAQVNAAPAENGMAPPAAPAA